jgi:hypothetical protein
VDLVANAKRRRVSSKENPPQRWGGAVKMRIFHALMNRAFSLNNMQ